MGKSNGLQRLEAGVFLCHYSSSDSGLKLSMTVFYFLQLAATGYHLPRHCGTPQACPLLSDHVQRYPSWESHFSLYEYTQ